MDSSGPSQEPNDAEELYTLSRRNDLNEAVGLIVVLPDHSIGDRGSPIWGRSPEYGTHSDVALKVFSEDMESVVNDVVSYDDRVPPLVRKIPSHLYETGPAAQTWPQVALMLWEDVRPYLQDIDMLVSIGLAVELLKQRVATWHQEKNQEIGEQYGNDVAEGRTPSVVYMEPKVVITQGSAVALAVKDLVNRHGVAGRIQVNTFPRGFPGYSDASHPSWSTTYLVQCMVGRRSFIYHFLTDGKLHEHYLLSGSKITLLPIPGDDQESVDMFRTIFPGLGIQVGGTKTSEQA